MRKLERIFGIVAFVAFVLKIFDIFPVNIFLILSLLILSILYYPLGFALFNNIRMKQILKKDSYQGLSVLHIIGSIGAGIALSTSCLGILFKLLHWPNGEIYVLTGLVTSLVVFIIAIAKYVISRDKYYLSIFIRLIITSVVSLIIVFLYN